MKKFFGLCAVVFVLLFASSALAAPPSFTAAAVEGNQLVLSGGPAKLTVEFLDPATARVEFLAPGIESEFATHMTVPGGLAAAKLEEYPGAVSGAGLTVKYTLAPLTLSFVNAEGVELARLVGLDHQADGSYSLRFAKISGDRFYGLGESFPGYAVATWFQPLALDRNGHREEIWNMHRPPSDLGMPFWVSPRGYGLLIENPVRAEVNLRGLDARYSAQGGPARFFILAGDPYQVLDTLADLTGRTPVPPRWATGYMQSRYGYHTQKDYYWLMENFRGRKIPCDVLIFDLDWFAHGDDIRMGNLSWSPVQFPDSARLMADLKARGFKAINIIEPYIQSTSHNYRTVLENKYGATNAAGEQYKFEFWGVPDSVITDYSNPAARAWYAEQVKAIRRTGVDAWWTDLNEPEKDFPDLYFGGMPGFKQHNLQALLMHQGMAEMYAKEFPDERLFIMSRASFIGGWRYGASIWSGDVTCSWSHLAKQPVIAQGAGLSGFLLWNSDAGGFHGKPSPELYTRWMQFAAFCPVFRAHGSHQIREPFSFGDRTEAAMKKLFAVRYRLSPYLYTVLHEAHASGKPVMRAMFLEFPGDRRAEAAINQYMYGPWLLVAPVTTRGARGRSVYLPKGTWTDFWTGKKIAGGRRVWASAPYDQIPLFVREGAIIPMGPEQQYIGEKPDAPIELHLYPGAAPTSWRIYDDDGATNAYLRGDYSLTEVRIEGKQAKVTKVEGSRETPKFSEVWH